MYICDLIFHFLFLIICVLHSTYNILCSQLYIFVPIIIDTISIDNYQITM